MKLPNFYYTLILLIFSSFLLGFYFNENSSGGAIDILHIYKNYNLFEKYSLKDIPWQKYESTSLPLYYVITSFLFDFKDSSELGLFNLIISFFSFFLFYQILKLNFNEKINLLKNYQLLLLASIIFLGPYFRTSTFWGLEEIVGIFFLLTSIYFYKIYKKNKSFLILFFCIFFSCLCFYTRQSYIFLLVLIFFNLINFKKLFDKKNYFIVFLFIILLLPSLYLFIIWNGLFPPDVSIVRDMTFLQFKNIPFILNIILIYLIPCIFLLFENIKDLYKFILDKKFIFMIFYTINFLLLINIEVTLVGGGAISKFYYLFLGNEKIFKIFFSLSASISALLIYRFRDYSNFLLFFFVIIIFTFLNTGLIFQEYFDPITMIFLLSFFDFSKIKKNIVLKFPIYNTVYYLAFLTSSLFYYYKIV